MHRNRTWQIDPTELRSQRNRILPIEGGDGSTLSLDFTTMSGTLDSRITFSRADATARATFINSGGFVEKVPVGQPQAPRFDFNPLTLAPKGLLLEAPATNILVQGTDCWGGGGSVWGRSAGVNINAVSGSAGILSPRINGPDNGTLTGTSITKDPGLPSNFVRHQGVSTVSSTPTQLTYSMYARAGVNGETNFRLAVFNGGTHIVTVGGCSDPSVTITNSATFGSQFSNMPTTRWVRVWVVFTTLSGQTSLINAVYPNINNSSAVENFIWGAQIEIGSAPSSVIPTLATTLVRAADTAIIAAGTNFSSWYTGGTTGTFVANWHSNPIRTTASTVVATTDLLNKHLHMLQSASALTLRLADFGAVGTVTTSNSMTAGAITKGAFSYASTSTSLCLNGGTVATGTLAFTVDPTWLSIGGPSTTGTSITDTGVMLNNNIRSIKYFPARLSNVQLQALTS